MGIATVWEDYLSNSSRFLPLLLASVLVLAACSSRSLSLSEPTLPAPLLTPLPLRVGIKYSPEMHDFTHREDLLQAQQWTISLGAANKLLYDQIFKAMFRETVFLSEEQSPEAAGVDILIRPSVEAFEFALPQQSRSETYTVWIRYRLRVFDRSGTEIANWPVSAYGKSGAGKFDGNKAIQRATALAMRDAAALVSMRFASETGLLNRAANGESEEPAPNTNEALVDDVTSTLDETVRADNSAGGTSATPDISSAEKLRNDQG